MLPLAVPLGLAATLGLASPPRLLAAPAADPVAEADLSEAERLFNEGQARYEAADYEGAVETFTLALSEVRSQGVDAFTVLGPLLFNIGRAHTRAYEINREIEHLRQAQAIFVRFVEGAEAFPEQVTHSDVDEARAQLDALAEQLAELEQHEQDPAGSDPRGEGEGEGELEPGAGEKMGPIRQRDIGAGLLGGGIALLGGGVGLVVWGLGYGPAAQSQVAAYAELGLSEEHPVFDAGAEFVTAERRKGTAWAVAGAAVTTVGLVGVAVGASLLAKSAKRARARKGAAAFVPELSFGPRGAMLGLHGRF